VVVDADEDDAVVVDADIVDTDRGAMEPKHQAAASDSQHRICLIRQKIIVGEVATPKLVGPQLNIVTTM
jgi:hypothetical protein